MKKLFIAIGIMLLCLVSVADAGAKPRSSKSVKHQQRITEQKIKQTDAQIRENARQLKSKLNDLNRLQAESQTINSTIAGIQASIDSLDVEAQAARDSAAKLDSKLTELKDVYADILRNSRRSRMSLSFSPPIRSRRLSAVPTRSSSSRAGVSARWRISMP